MENNNNGDIDFGALFARNSFGENRSRTALQKTRYKTINDQERICEKIRSKKQLRRRHLRSAISVKSNGRLFIQDKNGQKRNIFTTEENRKAKYQIIGQNSLKRVYSTISQPKTKICLLNDLFPNRIVEKNPPMNYTRYKSYKLQLNRQPQNKQTLQSKNLSDFVSVIGVRIL